MSATLDEPGTRGLDLAAWKELSRFVLAHRGRALALCAVALLTAAIDTSFPLVTRRVVDDVVAHGLGARLAGSMAIYAALMVVEVGLLVKYVRAGVAGAMPELGAPDDDGTDNRDPDDPTRRDDVLAFAY